MAITPSQLKAEAAKHGCTLEIEKDVEYDICLTAPKGKIFAGTDTHVDCGLHGNGWIVAGQKIDWSRTRDDMRASIADGFADCTDPECEFCNDV